MTWIEYLIAAAQKSRGNFELWLRYLNKVITRDEIFLSPAEIEQLTQSSELSPYQRVFLQQACIKHSQPWEMTVSFSEPAQLGRLKNVLKQLS